jgi:hypothetical protein
LADRVQGTNNPATASLRLKLAMLVELELQWSAIAGDNQLSISKHLRDELPQRTVYLVVTGFGG